jgi:hypothetical protein
LQGVLNKINDLSHHWYYTEFCLNIVYGPLLKRWAIVNQHNKIDMGGEFISMIYNFIIFIVLRKVMYFLSKGHLNLNLLMFAILISVYQMSDWVMLMRNNNWF